MNWKVFDRSEVPDYEILQAVLHISKTIRKTSITRRRTWFSKYENASYPAAVERIGDVEAEHELETSRLRRLIEAVDKILAGREFRAKRSTTS